MRPTLKQIKVYMCIWFIVCELVWVCVLVHVCAFACVSAFVCVSTLVFECMCGHEYTLIKVLFCVHVLAFMHACMSVCVVCVVCVCFTCSFCDCMPLKRLFRSTCKFQKYEYSCSSNWLRLCSELSDYCH